MSNINESNTELVITAPEPYGALLTYQTRCRSTIGVLTQLIAKAKKCVIISAPFMQSGHGLSSGVLADALRAALKRGVNIKVLSTGPSLQTINNKNLMKKASGRLEFFQPVAHLVDEQQLGSHAKFCVADGQAAYVGSANLTGRGLSGQIEMGVMIRGPIAHQIEQFWNASIEQGLFVPLMLEIE